jgi:RpiB/LacA/LacB family sugar-phosphate isomerase
MIVAIGTDHAARVLQDRIVSAVVDAGHEALVFTVEEPDAACEYPDIARSVGAAIVEGRAERGILVCGSGAGMVIAANKVHGIRAATAHDTYTAHQMVEHDDANMLTLGSRVIGPELAAELVSTFLSAQFTGAARYIGRIAKVTELEREGR